MEADLSTPGPTAPLDAEEGMQAFVEKRKGPIRKTD